MANALEKGKEKRGISILKRFISTALIALAGLCALFADTYTIDRYDFVFEGKTDAARVYDYLKIADNTSFESYDVLSGHVRSKAQDLVNARIFTSVDYTVVENPSVAQEDGSVAYHYIARYSVNDKSPFFIFPTPKYDSNYGMKIGLRVDSKNFGGKLAQFQINADMKQNEHSFSKAEYGLDFNISGYPVASFDMDSSFSIDYNGSTGGLKGLSMAIASKVYNIKVINDVKFSLSGSLEFTPSSDAIDSFGCSEFTYTATLDNMLKSIGGISLYQYFQYTPRNKTTYTANYAYYYGLSLKGIPITTRLGLTTTKAGDDPIGLTASEYFAISFGLPWGFYVSPSINLYRSYGTDGTWNMKGWSVAKRISVGLSLSRSNIRYVLEGNDDFRKGMTLSMYASRDMEFLDMLKDPIQYMQVQFSWFPYANNWFNPSIRITGSVSSDPTWLIPSLSSDSPTLSDYMRGIRDDNEFNKVWNTKVVANINLTTKCINLGSWARTYAIAFTDIAMVKNKDSEVKMLYTVGIEGIGIINDHPNYPVRASLGFNVDSLKTFSETNRFEDLEYELTFGLYYFY